MRQTHRNGNLYLPVAAILSGMLLVASTHASQVRPLNLEEMTDRAAVKWEMSGYSECEPSSMEVRT
jgi:hypothetical protein